MQSEHVNNEEDLTLLIDFQKYRQTVNARRHPRNAKSVKQTNSSNVCTDVEKEEYQKCGKNCVLGCRYDSLVSENVTVTAVDNCNATNCTEGCFCKDGFIRYHHKCIPAAECPTRKTKSIDLPFNGYGTEYPARFFGIFQRPCGPTTVCKPLVVQKPIPGCKNFGNFFGSFLTTF